MELLEVLLKCVNDVQAEQSHSQLPYSVEWRLHCLLVVDRISNLCDDTWNYFSNTFPMFVCLSNSGVIWKHGWRCTRTKHSTKACNDCENNNTADSMFHVDGIGKNWTLMGEKLMSITSCCRGTEMEDCLWCHGRCHFWLSKTWVIVVGRSLWAPWSGARILCHRTLRSLEEFRGWLYSSCFWAHVVHQWMHYAS